MASLSLPLHRLFTQVHCQISASLLPRVLVDGSIVKRPDSKSNKISIKDGRLVPGSTKGPGKHKQLTSRTMLRATILGFAVHGLTVLLCHRTLYPATAPQCRTTVYRTRLGIDRSRWHGKGCPPCRRTVPSYRTTVPTVPCHHTTVPMYPARLG